MKIKLYYANLMYIEKDCEAIRFFPKVNEFHLYNKESEIISVIKSNLYVKVEII